MSSLAERQPPRAASWLVRVLCLLVLPIVLVTAGPAAPGAYAATKNSGTHGLNWRPMDTFVPGTWLACSLTLYYSTSTTASVGIYSERLASVGGDCNSGANFDGSGTVLSISAQGEKGNGAYCEFNGGVTIGSDESDWNITNWLPGAGTGGAGNAYLGAAADLCEVTTVCIEHSNDDGWAIGQGFTYSQCFNASMGPPVLPVASATCTHGVPTKVSLTEDAEHRILSWVEWQAGSVTDATAGRWLMSGFKANGTVVSVGTWDIVNGQPQRTSRGGDATVEGPIGAVVGWQMEFTPNFAFSGVAVPYANLDPNALPSNGGYRGTTDPPKCVYYFGPKLWDDPNTTRDEPWGVVGTSTDPDAEPPPAPVGTPETRDDGACSFSISDPGTWLSGGMCAAVGLLGRAVQLLADIAGTLTGLAGAIAGAIADALSGLVDAILDGLAALFVPSQASITAVTDGATDAWDDGNAKAWLSVATDGVAASPGGLVAGRAVPGDSPNARLLPGGVDAGAGDCSGPSFTWDKFGEVGLPEQIEPFNACEGTAATLAMWCHLICTAFVCIFGALKITEITLQSMGLVKQINILSSYDWNSAGSGRYS